MKKSLGSGLKSNPAMPLVATKVAGAASGWFVPPIRHGYTAIDRHHVETAVEGSLRRLGVDYIDLYQVHWPDTVVPIDESMEALDRLVESGKVRYLNIQRLSLWSDQSQHRRGLWRLVPVSVDTE